MPGMEIENGVKVEDDEKALVPISDNSISEGSSADVNKENVSNGETQVSDDAIKDASVVDSSAESPAVLSRNEPSSEGKTSGKNLLSVDSKASAKLSRLGKKAGMSKSLSLPSRAPNSHATTKRSPEILPVKASKNGTKTDSNSKAKTRATLVPLPRNGAVKEEEEERHSTASSNGQQQKIVNVSTFSFRLEERAEKRKQFFTKVEEKIQAKEAEKSNLQAKSKENQEAEIKQLRKSLTFKATPMPTFYKEPPPKVELKKIPITRPKSPKLGRHKVGASPKAGIISSHENGDLDNNAAKKWSKNSVSKERNRISGGKKKPDDKEKKIHTYSSAPMKSEEEENKGEPENNTIISEVIPVTIVAVES